ncbi:MAG: extradiol ring-cleavage dioxygenase [Dehalococcoidia bacterium]|nr:extradiol ring-cleavage dioxygenase [Dehalococcoidia bacterium]
MGEILGVGLTHYPGLVVKDEQMCGALKKTLRDPGLPEQYRDPKSWPAQMQAEWSDDQGTAAATQHRKDLLEQFKTARAAIDDFKPDFVLIWGDDQYENFQEDCVPAFCVLAYDKHEAAPFHDLGFLGNNVWDLPVDTAFSFEGHKAGGKYLATGLLEQGFDVAYAYKPLHHGLGHAFLNAALFMDYDNQGSKWKHPLLPVQVNDYGRRVIAQKAGLPDLANPIPEGELDPPSPMPWRCFDLGAATARALKNSPWRVALVASSSWSHAFLTTKNHWIYPDVEADRRLYDALVAGDYQSWRNTPLDSLEESGQQELMNWFCLVGAMDELGRKPDEHDLIQTYIFNSSKCFAIFRP